MRGVSFLAWILSGYMVWLFIVKDPTTGKAWILSMGDLLVSKTSAGITGAVHSLSKTQTPWQTMIQDLLGMGG